MNSGEWRKTMQLFEERLLPSGCCLHVIQVQLRDCFRKRRITRAQWAEFETQVHRLDPGLPWLA